MGGPLKLHHERLDVYQVALEFMVFATELSRVFPRGHGAMAEQLRDAAQSIPFNIAEGCGRRGPADRCRFYDIASGSAHECGAIFDGGNRVHVIGDDAHLRGKTLLHRIISMLVKMIARQMARLPETHHERGLPRAKRAPRSISRSCLVK